ncbi:hypothetical protein [Nocardioides bizhenqiangii]|uniref:Lipoprotein n=1 Tax=Nocardioides bizhenqiangii TaxID=3095076 RepID=A0ABZ0ZRM1_9ACTN|nr:MULTISPECIES: hypothetical protein [unclassified Nocardioides]MDZ5619555.1 hypothetical protein [Nocardioides sp. HM23]WQQ26429.1 hypothetical protein SHK19_21045 [Nocardioides sp. HM61]
MTRIKRATGAAGAAVLLAFSLTACGGAPDDASEEDFCEVANSIPADADVDAIHDWADDAEETGTPEDIPEDAREGFELLVDIAKDVDEDDLENEDFLDDLSSEEEEQFTAYGTYVAETCGGADVPTEDLPTEELTTE